MSTTEAAVKVSKPARYIEALAIKKAEGKRGQGIKVTDDELAAWCVEEAERSPGITGRQAVEVAYWIDRFAVSAARAEAAFNEANGIAVAPKATTTTKVVGATPVPVEVTTEAPKPKAAPKRATKAPKAPKADEAAA